MSRISLTHRRKILRELGRSSHRVWLAGLGALISAELNAEGSTEGAGLFQALVEKGRQAEEELGGADTGVLGLLRVREIFDLSQTELGQLFGTSRQAVSAWQHRGIPSARRAKLHTLLEIGELLERNLKPGRAPAVFRKPAPAYGGESMFERVRQDRQDEVLEAVRESFDWSGTA